MFLLSLGMTYFSSSGLAFHITSPGGLPGLMCLNNSFISKVPIVSLHGEFANAYLLVCLLVRHVPHWNVSSMSPGAIPGLCSHLYPALSTMPAYHH